MKESLHIFSSKCELNQLKDTIKCSYPDPEHDGETLIKSIPIERLNDIEIYGNINITNPLFLMANKIGVPIYFNSYYGVPYGKFIPANNSHPILTINQVKTFLDPLRKDHISRAIVSKAIENRLYILKKFDKKNLTISHQEKMRELKSKITDTVDTTKLRGIEGNYMKEYFQGFSKILYNLKFDGRSQQPPKDSGNAIMSWGNVLLYNKVREIMYHTGLDCSIGFLHEPRENRDSLAIDIAEIFRPMIVDQLILRLDHKGTLLDGSHFQKDEFKTYLNKKGKEIWIREWKEYLQKTIKYPTLNRRIAIHEEIKIECYNLIKYINQEKDEYIPLYFNKT